jgi:signal transduction histidine kinase
MLSQTAAETPADTARTSQCLGQIFQTAREMTRSMDEIVWAVNPRHDTLESLFDYLARFAHEFLTPARIRCRLQVPVEFPDRPVRSEVRHNLFMAFKESLNNIVRHSGATEVLVTIDLEGNHLRLAVRDNGHGLPGAQHTRTQTLATSPHQPDPLMGRVVASTPASSAERLSPGHGLENMQYRLRRIGGHAAITSVAPPARGLQVELLAPLDPASGTASAEAARPGSVESSPPSSGPPEKSG